MKLRVLDGPREVAWHGAEILARAAKANAQLVLGLPTGRTAIPFYDELARRHQAGALDLSRARAINVDELVLPPDHPSSFRAFMERHSWQRIGLDPARCEIPRADCESEERLRAECRRYDALVEAAGGLDLAVLGLGVDGHVAYNLPGREQRNTHGVELPDALAEQLDVPRRWRPLRAITLGMGAFRDARQLLLMASGEAKAAAVHALIEGPADPQWPVSLLRLHSEFTVLVDRAAAGRLVGQGLAGEGDDR